MGASSDARAKSVYAPRAEGQVAALRRAYQAAGCGPETMDLLEAHGTGTQAGDVAEMEALRAVYDECGRPDRQWCALGTVKSQVGHTKAAAGAAGLFKAVMALRHAVLPPTIKVERPDPRLDLENSPFYLNTVARPWAKDPAVPRRAAVSAFGFGGANYHAVVEEYRGAGVKAWRTRTSPVELVVVCGKSVEEVAERCRHLAATVVGHPCLQFLARATQETYDPQAAARLGLVATDETDLKQKLLKAAEMCAQGGGKPVSDSGLGIHLGVGREEGLLAFMFPGQSSHYLGMGADLAFAFEQAQAVWDQAATYVYEDGTIPGAVFPRPAFDEKTKAAQAWRLVGTRWAQPAVACVARAHLNLLETMGVKPDCVGAHSYGDAVALHAAGCYDFPTLVGLCRKRGELVQQADQPNPGSMTSVVCSAQDIKALLAERPTAVTFAGENAAQSTVITGPLPDLVEVEKRLAERSIQFRRLPIDGSGHSMLHEPASKGWEAWMKNVRFRLPALPVFANSDPSPYPADEDAIKHRLAYEVSWPVRFVEQVEAMYAHGVRTFIEVGPGGVICQLLGLCLQGRPHRAINLDKRGQNGQATWWTALAQVVAAGVPATLAPLWAEYAPLADPREVKRSSTAVEISGTVYGKTYPPAGGASALPPPNPPGGAAWTGQPGSVPGMASLASVAPAETLSTLRDMAERLSAAHQSYQGAMTAALSAYQRSMTDNQAAVTRLGGSVPPPVRKENQ
jgi:acyl transferase domain-containing protein